MSLNDPFLAAIQVDSAAVFELGHYASPISLRDQINRACLFVAKAIDAKLLDPADPTKRLLVVGAGAAGATAALRAAELKIPTTLIEQADDPFVRQFGSQVRTISPTHYDWPLDGWSENWHPSPAIKTTLPLSAWRADRANYRARIWRIVFQAEVARLKALGYLEYQNGHRLKQMPTTSQPLTQSVAVDLEKRLPNPNPPVWDPVRQAFDREDEWVDLVPGELPDQFAVVLLACGFGPEITYLTRLNPNDRAKSTVATPFRGFDFWSDDQLDQIGRHLPNGKRARVLIAGGGDGALQDYIRLTTRPPFGRKPWELLNQLAIPSPIFDELRAAETHAQRSWPLHGRPPAASGATHDHFHHQRLHQIYERLIPNLVRQNQRALQTIVRDQTTLPALHLVHRCTHLDNHYPLNRFLTLLIAEYLRCSRKHDDGTAMETIHPETVATWVECRGHDPLTQPPLHRPVYCFARPHHVTFAPAPSCQQTGVPPSRPASFPDPNFNVIIIRFGVDAPRITSGKKVLRQILPTTTPY